MTLHDVPHDTPADSGSNAPGTSEQLARQEAIKQIERRRRAGPSTTAATIVAAIGTYLGNRYWSFRTRQRTCAAPPDGRA